jgi:hypothetical protein
MIKILKFFVADPDPGIRDGKVWINPQCQKPDLPKLGSSNPQLVY